MVGRVFESRLMGYRRTFRASIFSSFVSPILFLTAMGIGLGGYVSNDAALDGVPYLVFLAPGLLAATAMQSASFEATFPIMGGLVWNKVFHAMYATPISPRDIALGNLLWIAARLTLICSIFTFVIVAVRGGRVAAHHPGDPGRGPDRDGVRGADRGLRGDPEDTEQVRLDLPLRDHPAVPVLRDVLPDLARCRRRSRRWPG